MTRMSALQATKNRLTLTLTLTLTLALAPAAANDQDERAAPNPSLNPNPNLRMTRMSALHATKARRYRSTITTGGNPLETVSAAGPSMERRRPTTAWRGGMRGEADEVAPRWKSWLASIVVQPAATLATTSFFVVAVLISLQLHRTFLLTADPDHYLA